jgi:hypothetical protein
VQLATDEKDSILAAVPSNEREKGAKLLEDLLSDKVNSLFTFIFK